jgi:methylated-DNA-[protein]-cysteine S-methyltransferase
VQLPEGSERATRSRALRRFPTASEAAPPAHVQRTMEDIVALLGGERRELGHATLDREAVPDFNRRVYDVARTIPAGSTWSYGEIAERLGDRNLARDVAQALGQNPFPIIGPAIASWRRAAKWADFRRPAASAPSSACCRSSGHSRVVQRCSLISP